MTTSRLLRTRCLLLLLICASAFAGEAYDALDPNGNITLKWDIQYWTGDGYVKYLHIQDPGWALEWEWSKGEVIYVMFGAEAIEQGDCSKFKGDLLPHCCMKRPTIVDLMPVTSYNQQSANCCKGGVLNSWVQDPSNHIASFQIDVGRSETSKETVQAPTSFTLKTPGPGYTCEKTKEVPPSKFLSLDGRRTTQALYDTGMLWGIKDYNDLLMEVGPMGYVQSELLFRKDLSSFTFRAGWAFPRCVYFNGDNCVMPPTDAYPQLPNLTTHLIQMET